MHVQLYVFIYALAHGVCMFVHTLRGLIFEAIALLIF